MYFKQFCRKCQKGYNPYRVEAIQCQVGYSIFFFCTVGFCLMVRLPKFVMNSASLQLLNFLLTLSGRELAVEGPENLFGNGVMPQVSIM